MAVTPPSPPGPTGGRGGTGGWSRDDLIFFAVFLGVAASVATVNTLSRIDELERFGAGGEPWQPMVWEFSSVILITALLPAVMWLARRFAPRRPPPWGWIGVHAAALVVFSAIHVIGMGSLRAAAYRVVGDRYDALAPLANWPYELRKDALIYLVLTATYLVWRLLRAPARPAAAAGEVALEVRDGARRFYVPPEDILWVEAAGNYVELHRAGGAVLHRASLQEIEARLAGRGFIRIHRSRLVRRAAIAETQTKPSGDFTVTLRGGQVLTGSRRYRQALDAASA